ncbi:primosomal protein N' [Weissella oryzae SG25]|uniref:Replication restart protein PriA n=1 Tax=Weissella oryzae (strain DSM 25784 / JCM 18191 / LMG 30913 / SG25) TaxID=1329250 RepID=A0A069CTT7_WEIOS|nr:primosomal protein N' [Weissella oryzae]GAK30658.1 primosomal protein N' [Weissella oryzae SG25]
MKQAAVIVDVPTMQTNQPYTYLVPESLEQLIEIGMRVTVPFGRGNRLVQGFVTEVQSIEPSETNLKSIEELIEPTAVLNTELLALGAWLANRNFAFKISVLQMMLPNVMRAKYTKTLQALNIDAIEDPQVKQLFIDRNTITFDSENVPVELLANVQRALRLNQLQIGYIVGNRAKEKLVLAIKPALSASEYDQIRQGLRSTAHKQAHLLTYLMTMSNEYLPQAELIKLLGIDAGLITRAAKNGWVEQAKIEVYRLPKLTGTIETTQALKLNSEQLQAYQAITETVIAKQNETFLLEGITGSGKTEVYLQAIAETLAIGRTALMLVPEITLTPQMVRRVQGRFGAQVAVMHSGLSDGERYDEWRRIKRGEVKVVVGARSAIFAPLENIGLIIIDEEHEGSYKQDENPRYHARDVAIWRAEYHHATVVLGSATPSLESRARAQKGRYKLLKLTKRAQNSSLPTATIVDMREALQNGSNELFSPLLAEKLVDRLKKSEQSVLLLNRRGYANFLMCRDCGYVPKCKNCDLALTMHTDTGRMECHYCGYSEPIPNKCVQCGSERIRPYGAGTQKVEQVLHKEFPQARIMRMDVDTTRRKGSVDQMLTDFGEKKADILLGTQMIAKGLDFPDITLVGVLNADTSLSVPDFRASERTFQLLTQVAGRAGRADKQGEVVIQTFNPEHYAIQLASQQNFEAFYETEMRLRHTWQYSPYFYTLQIKIAHEDQAVAAKIAYQTANWLKQKLAIDSTLLGPAAGAVSRLKNKYYYRMLIKFKNDDGLEMALKELMLAAQRLQKQKVILTIDRDPNNFI